MKNFFGKIKLYVVAHKIISAVIIIVVLFVGYFGYNKLTSTKGDTRYVTQAVQKGTLVASVSGSGQVESSSELDLQARGTGMITYVGVKAGDTVKKGRLLFSLDARDAKSAVKSAETNLETVQLDLEKFQKPPDTVDVLAIKKAIADAETSKLDAAKTVADKYRDLLNTSIAASSSDTSNIQVPPTISGTYLKDQEATITINTYQAGSQGYFTVKSDPEGAVSGFGTISTVIPQAIGDSGLYIKFSTASSGQPSWIIYLPNKSVAAYNTNYTAYQNALEDQKKANDAADLTIAQNNKNLNDLYQPDALTLKTKQLAVKQAQDSLDNANAKLSDYYVVAPFDGTIASVTGKVGSPASGILGSIITNQKIATISLNEVDVAKIKLGQKATLTFDAVPDLTITGEVAEIDSVGTVSQGVVTYNVKINFDTQDIRVKPAMSVNAAIITDIKQDVLIVPNSAVKSSNGTSYVEMFDTTLPPPTDGLIGSISKTVPNKIPVEVGLTNDSQSEIISGIKEGDEIVTRTILPSTTTTPTAPSIFGAPGGNRGGGSGIRIQTGGRGG